MGREVIENQQYLSIWIFFANTLERSADLFFRLLIGERGDTPSIEGVEPQNRPMDLQELAFYFGDVERPDSLAVVGRLGPRRVEKPTI